MLLRGLRTTIPHDDRRRFGRVDRGRDLRCWAAAASSRCSGGGVVRLQSRSHGSGRVRTASRDHGAPIAGVCAGGEQPSSLAALMFSFDVIAMSCAGCPVPRRGHGRGANDAKAVWALAITSVAVFMVTLDNLVVDDRDPGDPPGPARRSERASVDGQRLHARRSRVLLLTGAALGDRFGRRRLLAIGVAIFTAASAGAALAPSIVALDVARALQGVGGAIVMPLTLTVLSAAVPAARRGVALGIWGGISGLAVAAGAAGRRRDRHGHLLALDLLAQRADRAGAPALHPPAPRGDARTGVQARPARSGPGQQPALSRSCGRWSAPTMTAGPRRRSSARSCLGGALLAAFVAWELRAEHPMLPMRFFRNRTFALANVASLFMFFGMFGSIFFIAQFFQTVQGLLAVSVGAADPALDGDADARRADRRRRVRPDRRPAADGSRADAAGDRAGMGSPSVATPTAPTLTSSGRSRSRASAWRCSSPPSPTSSCPPFGRRRKGRPPGPTTPSVSLAACSAWPCSPPCSPPTAATSPVSSSSNGMNPAVMIGAALVAVGAIARSRSNQTPLAIASRLVPTAPTPHGLRVRLLLVRAAR